MPHTFLAPGQKSAPPDVRREIHAVAMSFLACAAVLILLIAFKFGIIL